MSKFFKKNFTLLLFTFFIIPVTWSQTSSLSERKVIHWMGIKSFGDTLLPSHKFLYFTGAFFPSPADGLPSYSENFPVFQGFGLPQVYLMNPVYVSLTVEETAVIVNPSGIPCQPQIDVKLVTQRKKQEACVQFFPFRRDTLTGTIQRLESFQLSVRYDVDSKPTGVSTHLYAQHSVLSQGTWYKIGVKYTGIYKLTYTDLQSMGIDPASVNPKNIRIFGNGGAMLPEANSAFRYDDLVENSIQVVGEDDGVFNTQDYILFYCKSPDSWKLFRLFFLLPDG
ncbi:MAG: hypothetical protein NTU44_08850 [Bacteroidetes bacterium]|nr:hypothetical protein [Bacteroidota bacterium]